MNWQELLHIWISDKASLNIEVGPSLLIIFGLLILAVIVFRVIKSSGLIFNETELNISLGGVGNIQIKRNHDVVQIAHKAWAELITRKAGLQFDADHDLIVEVLTHGISFLLK